MRPAPTPPSPNRQRQSGRPRLPASRGRLLRATTADHSQAACRRATAGPARPRKPRRKPAEQAAGSSSNEITIDSETRSEEKQDRSSLPDDRSRQRTPTPETTEPA